MKVTVTSDGSNRGTRVTGPDGAPIEGVRALTFRAAVDEIASLDIELVFVTLDRLEGEATFYGPAGKPIRRIEYVDGTVDEFAAAD